MTTRRDLFKIGTGLAAGSVLGTRHADSAASTQKTLVVDLKKSRQTIRVVLAMVRSRLSVAVGWS